jgi:carboxyl-terminal processing protease
MVNTYSASASEILAAAMQDYKRAIIVGTKSTYGKGTVQNFADLDQLLPQEYNDIKPLGAIKLTIQKFYRINGGATQLKGVVPDIIFPDEYDLIEFGEEEMDFSLAWDEIEKANYQPVKGKLSNIEQVKINSQKRIASDSVFIKVGQKAKLFKELRDETNSSLNMNTYLAEKAKNEKATHQLDNIYKPLPLLSVNMLSDDQLIFGKDDAYNVRFKDWEKTIKKDHQLFEVLNIVHEMQ